MIRKFERRERPSVPFCFCRWLSVILHSLEYAQRVYTRVFARVLPRAFTEASTRVLGRVFTRVSTRAFTRVVAKIFTGVLRKNIDNSIQKSLVHHRVCTTIFRRVFTGAFARVFTKKSLDQSLEYSQGYAGEYFAVVVSRAFPRVIRGAHKPFKIHKYSHTNRISRCRTSQKPHACPKTRINRSQTF